jgi:hypothetical protein
LNRSDQKNRTCEGAFSAPQVIWFHFSMTQIIGVEETYFKKNTRVEMLAVLQHYPFISLEKEGTKTLIFYVLS